MRPLKGIVVDTNGGRLGVRLANQATVHVAKQKGLRLGDTCYIFYDYTMMEARSVMTEDEVLAGNQEPRLTWDDEEEPDWVDANELAAQSMGVPVVSL